MDEELQAAVDKALDGLAAMTLPNRVQEWFLEAPLDRKAAIMAWAVRHGVRPLPRLPVTDPLFAVLRTSAEPIRRAFFGDEAIDAEKEAEEASRQVATGASTVAQLRQENDELRRAGSGG